VIEVPSFTEEERAGEQFALMVKKILKRGEYINE